MLLASNLVALASTAPTIEIAPGVHLPMVSDGYDFGKQTNATTNYTSWLALGGRGIDTAWSYFNQQAVGKSLREQSVVSRSDIFLTTKIECMGSEASTIKAGEQDLTLLGMDYVDLLLIHAPYQAWGEPYSNCSKGPAGKAARQATWRGMEALQRAGKARSIGVSNFNSDELSEILEISAVPPALNQAAFCVGFADNATIAFQRQHKIAYQAYSPLGGTDWGGHWSALSVPEVKAIAAAHGRSTAQVALRYVVQQGIPLATATNNPKYQQEDLGIFDFTLSAHEMAVLNSVRAPGPPP